MKKFVKHGEHTLSSVIHGVTAEHMQLFAKRLKKHMGKEIKDGDLARAIPCSAPTVRRWRLGAGLPTLRSAIKIASYFKTEPFALVQGTPLEGLYKASLAPAVPALRDNKTVTTPAKSISTEAAAAAHPPVSKTNGGNGTHHPAPEKKEDVSSLPPELLSKLDQLRDKITVGRKVLDDMTALLDGITKDMAERFKKPQVDMAAVREHLTKVNSLLQ
jgi:hypothetical protein